jgi:hypothetical protein
MVSVTAARVRSRGGVAATVLAGGLVVVAALLPWASYENRATGATTNYGAGTAGFVLAALALGAAGCALAGARDGRGPLCNLAVLLSAGCLVTAVVLAVTRMLTADDAASSRIGGSRTSYEAGALVGVVGAALLVLACVLLRQSRSRAGRPMATAPGQPS